MKSPARHALLGCVLALIADAAGAADPALIERGRLLYQFGQRGAPVVDGVEVRVEDGAESGTADEFIVSLAGQRAPLSLFPCANCHGIHGEGRSESGLHAPALHQWLPQHSPARRQQLFQRALSQGLGSTAQPLASAMPHYAFSAAESAALLAYLEQLEFAAVDGISSDAIQLQYQLPSWASAPGQALIEQYFTALNQHGGIFRRQLQAQPHTADLAPASNSALIYLDLNAPACTPQLSEQAITLRLFACTEEETSLSLWPSPQQQAQHLLQLALQQYSLESSQVVALNHVEQLELQDFTQARLIQIDARNSALLTAVHEHFSGATQAPVLLLNHWLDALSQQSAVINLLQQSYPGPIHTLVPDLPQRLPRELGLSYQRFRQEHALPQQAQTWQLWSFALLEQLRSSLEHSGRQLSREAFIQAWEDQQGRQQHQMLMLQINPD